MVGAQTPYYYAGGERVELQADPSLVAVELGAAAGKRAGARPLVGDWVLLPADAVRPRTRGAAPAELPVFRSGATLVVALPEVRVEDDDDAHLQALERWLGADPQRGRVLARAPGRLTLQAGPALGGDGLALAREAVERCGVRSASPRLVRVTPAPKR